MISQTAVSMHSLGHDAEIQVLRKHHPCLVTEMMGQLKMPVLASISNALMDPPNLLLKFQPVCRPLLLGLQSALQQCQLAVQFLEKARMLELLPIGRG